MGVWNQQKVKVSGIIGELKLQVGKWHIFHIEFQFSEILLEDILKELKKKTVFSAKHD